MSRYQIREEIGSGGQGKVYLGIDTLTGNTVALKKLLKSNELSTWNEIEILKILKEKSLFGSLVYYDSYETDDAYFIVTEYLGDYQVLSPDRDSIRDQAQIAELSVQLIASLEDIHKAGVAHRDIKPGNIMVDWTKIKCKYIDFGLACYQNDCNTRFMNGSLLWLYPKRFINHPNTLAFYQQGDQWSLASILYRLITRIIPYSFFWKIFGSHGTSIDYKEVARNLLVSPKYYDKLFIEPKFVEFHSNYPAIGDTIQKWLTS